MSSLRERVQTLPLADRARYEAIIDRFEEDWLDHPDVPPDISAHLPADKPLRTLVLVALVKSDMESRQSRHVPARAADYVGQFPELAGDAHAAAEVLAWEHELTSPGGDEPSDPSSAGRNLLRAEIGRGGIGIVLRAYDPQLGRELAVKILRKDHGNKPALVRRFLEEARILAQLQHPGVVPVHDSGFLDDGRPFFTMKLVEGRTLADLLTERPSPQHDQARFLAIFEQVCQTLAYAHEKRIIHRDLKPSNVMVGGFGQVQVMDWGFAKVLSRGAVSDAQAASTEEDDATVPPLLGPGSTAEESRTGTVMGTPAFMPPEQAGEGDHQVDERADVFGLGAVLCVLLTGRPPYTGHTRDEVLRNARQGDLAEALAGLDACGADTELVALCKDCLASRREDRPGDAGAVAARMAAYQAAVQERLRKAELERTAAQARAEEAKATAAAERKARRRTRALAAAMLALVAVGAGSGLVVQHQKAEQVRRDAEQRQAVEFALERASGLRQQGHWREAQAVLEQARRGLGDAGPDDLRQRLKMAENELALVDRLDAIRQRRATWVEGKFDTQTAERDYAAAFEEAGLGNVGEDEAAVARRVLASGVSGPLVAALDDWAFVAAELEAKLWLRGVARRADPNPWGDRFRDPAVWQNRQAVRALADDALQDGGAKLGELSPQVLESLAGMLIHGGAEAVPLLRMAQRRYPSDFWLNLDLGSALYAAKQYEEAVGYDRVAVALRPDAGAAHNNLGIALAGKKDLDGAIDEFRKAIDLDPKFALAHANLGLTLHDKKDVEGAFAECRQAIDLDPKLALAHSNLGVALHDKKDLDGAIAEYRTAIDLDPKFAWAHNNLGTALYDKQDLDGAIAEFRTAIDLDPKLAVAHANFGNVLRQKRNLDGAIAECRQAIDLDPKLAVGHYNLGAALRDKGDLDGVIAEYRKAVDLDPTHAAARNNLGRALRDKRDLDGAIAQYKRAVELDPTDADAHDQLGLALRYKGDLDGAIAEHRKAIDIDPKLARAHCNLGLALRDKGDLDGAVAEYRKAIVFDPTLAYAHGALGQELLQRGRFAEARTELRRCLELLSERDRWRPFFSRQLQLCERQIALDENLSAVLNGEAEAADAAERVALGQLCQQYKHLHAAAARFYAGAFAADAKLAEDLAQQHRHNAACSAALAAAGQAEDAKNLPDKVQMMLRRQALRWLRDDLALCAKLAEREEPAAKQAVRQRLAHWQQDADLATVRESQALDRLPDHERREWRQLWNDVAALLKTLQKEPLDFKLVPVARGTFWMGDRGSQRQVDVARDFYIATFPVTQGQWQEVMSSNPSWFSRGGGGADKVKDVSDADLWQFPVENVSWDDVQKFLKELNEREKDKGFLYRLPTEAEWEYACRGGATSREDCAFDFYFAQPTNDLSSGQANFNGNFPAGNAPRGKYLERTTRVGSYKPNRLGLYDMHGNVLQWCQDENREAGRGARVFRGGSLGRLGSECRASARFGDAPSFRCNDLGFRLAADPSTSGSGED